MTGKKFFRCSVCNDIHYGAAGPAVCPTCGAKNAYVEIDVQEARFVMEL
jgi:rubrerythrin